MGNKMSEYYFVVRAIKKLRKPPYKGIHTVYSGFNQAFKEYYDKNPVEVTNKLAEEGKIAIRPVRGGVMLYLPEEAPAPRGSANALKKILGDDDEESSLISDAIGSARTAVKTRLIDWGVLEAVSDREQAIRAIRESLSVTAGESSAVIRIAVSADSPKLAQMIVSKVIDLHLEYHLRANSSPGSLPFFSTQTEHLRQELDEWTQKMAAIKNENSLSSLNAKKDSLADQPVTLRGTVVKYNANILGSNFLHIQDGSGDSTDGSNDLVVTTQAEVAVGQTVVVSGTVVLDKDFGAGYSYPVLVENATVTVE